MLEDEFHHVPFELGKEALAGVFHEWYTQLKDTAHVV